MNFSGYLAEADEQKLVTEAFNSNPYDLTFGKKSAGDIFFTFHDEDDKEFRIQFYTPQGLGKNVRQVFIGTKKGASYLDSQQKFKNPMRVAATMIDATKQFLDTPIGKGIDGFAINFSKKVMDRGIALLPKIIRQSGLKQKLNVMDLKYSPDDSRGFVWVVRKGKDPASVFDGPKMKGITWDDPDKVGDVPVQASVGAAQDNPDWNISVMAKSASIESVVVKVRGNDVTLSSKDVAIAIRDGAIAKIAQTQSIAQVTIFDKQYVGRGSVDRVAMRMSDRQGMGWELKANGKVVVYVEFGVGALAPVATSTGSAPAQPDPSEGAWKYRPGSKQDQPVLMFTKQNGRQLYTASVAGYYDTPDKYALNSSDNQHLQGNSPETLIKMARLPFPDRNMMSQFYDETRAFWAKSSAPSAGGVSKLDISKIKRKSGDIAITQNNSAVVMNFTFRKFGTEIDGYSINKVLAYNETKNSVDITNTITNDKGKALQTASYSIPYKEGVVQQIYDEMSQELQTATGQLSLIDNDNYNPLKLKVGPVEIGRYGEILVGGTDISRASNRGFVLNRITSLTKDAEKRQKEQKKAAEPVDVIAELQKLQSSGREVDWQIRKINGGFAVNWDITFRRNTQAGAFMDNKAEIGAANSALYRMQAYMENLGYKVQSFILDYEDAKARDQANRITGQDPYSEYEQSLGGSIRATK